MWFNLHTHSCLTRANVVAVYNYSFQDYLSRVNCDHTCTASSEDLPTIYPLADLLENDCLPPYSASLHPWDITSQNASKQLTWLQAIVKHRQVVAIGEVGLDKLRGVGLSIQLDLFREIVQLAESAQLPLIIHQVKAMNELIALHKELHPTTPWIIHGFRGKKELALSALKQGFYLSFGVHYQPEALRATPIHRLFLETDMANIAIETLYQQAAELLNCSVEELQEAISSNAYSLFKRIKRE